MNALKMTPGPPMVKGQTRQLRDRTEGRGRYPDTLPISEMVMLLQRQGPCVCISDLLLVQRCRNLGYMWVPRPEGDSMCLLVLYLIWGPRVGEPDLWLAPIWVVWLVSPEDPLISSPQCWDCSCRTVGVQTQHLTS